MTLARRRQERRHGIAVVEVAVVLPLLVALLLGVWEVGRLIMLQNILDNAAREGARIAATAGFFASDNHTDPSSGNTITLNPPSGNGNFEVQQKVLTYLSTAGLDTSKATVKVENLGRVGVKGLGTVTAKSWSYTYPVPSPNTNIGSDPAAAADQLDHLRVTITIPYGSVKYAPTSLFIPQSTTLTAMSDWYSMRNYPLSVSTTIPSKPLQPTDPLP
jgi:Flp pilus assembly protein TadG